MTTDYFFFIAETPARAADLGWGRPVRTSRFCPASRRASCNRWTWAAEGWRSNHYTRPFWAGRTVSRWRCRRVTRGTSRVAQPKNATNGCTGSFFCKFANTRYNNIMAVAIKKIHVCFLRTVWGNPYNPTRSTYAARKTRWKYGFLKPKGWLTKKGTTSSVKSTTHCTQLWP